MWLQTLKDRVRSAPPGRRLGWILGGGVLFGLLLLPAVIYLAGITVLGSYEGAGLFHLYGSIYRGLAQGNLASWGVVLGPALLILLFRGLLAWWRRSALLAG